MLNTLVLFRLVRHEDSDNTYRLGHRLFELAHRVWESFDLRGAAAPVLDRLADETRETVALCSIDNHEILYIDQRSRGGAFGFRIEIGRRAPLHCTAGGKALLAFAPPHERRAMLDGIRLERFTDRTITDEEALGADLALARVRGYAISLEEHVEGVVSVAAPIFDHTGQGRRRHRRVRPACSRLSQGPAARHGPRPDGGRAAHLRQCRRHAGQHHAASRGRGRPATAMPIASCPGARISRRVRSGSPHEQRLYWVDILAPSVHRFDPATGTQRGGRRCRGS